LVATIQVRFAAKLTLFISVFAGVGCLYLLAKLDIVRSTSVFGEETISGDTISFSLPRGQQALYLSVMLVLILSANFIYAPTLVGQTTHSDEQFEAALAIDEHVTTTDRGYPASAVEAQWGDIRMYNYLINGEARNYNSNYEQVLTASHPDKRWQGLREGGRYLVITENTGAAVPGYQILFEGLGVGFGDIEETAGRFQPVYVGEDVRAFTTVEGATISVGGASGTEVTAETTVAVNGTETTYERSGVVENGAATIRVAHPGVYQIGEQTVAVSEEAVINGSQITVE
jgi:dolichyl-diphosphooligosaccharide--protein glycosyltransferase